MKIPPAAPLRTGGSPAVVMMGDSITEGFDTDRLLHGRTITNRGVSGDSTEECRARIMPEWFMPAPELLFLCIGTNDLVRDRTDEFILDGIRSIIHKMREHAQPVVYLTSLFPTRGNAPRPNERIRGLNRRIAALAEELGCRYYDLHGHFADAAGELRPEFTEDGLHLTEPAYQLWSTLLSGELDRYPASSR